MSYRAKNKVGKLYIAAIYLLPILSYLRLILVINTLILKRGYSIPYKS